MATARRVRHLGACFSRPRVPLWFGCLCLLTEPAPPPTQRGRTAVTGFGRGLGRSRKRLGPPEHRHLEMADCTRPGPTVLAVGHALGASA